MTRLSFFSFVLWVLGAACESAFASVVVVARPDSDTLFTLSTLVYPTARDCSTPVWEERGTYAAIRDFVVPTAPGLHRVDAKVYTDDGGLIHIEREYSEYFGIEGLSAPHYPQPATRSAETWRGISCGAETAWVASSTVYVGDDAAEVSVYDVAGRLLHRDTAKFEHSCRGLPDGVYVIRVVKGAATCAIVVPIVSD